MENQIFEKFTENTFEAYSKATKTELLELAKVLKISGRYDMNKETLINNIIASRNACDMFKERLNVNTANDTNDTNDKRKVNNMNNSTNNNTAEVTEVTEVTNAIEETKPAANFKEENVANAETDYAVQIGAETKRSQADYINNIDIGMIIAFKVSPDKAISAKVEDIDYDTEKEGITSRTLTTVYCRTKNGIEYKVPRKAIIWVKTGTRWPRGIFLQLKRGAENTNNNSFDEEIENIIDES